VIEERNWFLLFHDLQKAITRGQKEKCTGDRNNDLNLKSDRRDALSDMSHSVFVVYTSRRYDVISRSLKDIS